MIIAGTGTRSIVTSSTTMAWVIETMVEYLTTGIEKGVELTIISGMAEGFDEAIAKAAIACNVPFWAFVPHPTYGEYYWGRKSLTGRNRLCEYEELLAQADHVRTISETLYVKGVHANFVRNNAMVDEADKMWCYDPSSKGTSHCVAYTTKVGKPIFFVPMFNSTTV